MPVSLYLTNLISVLTLLLHCSIKQVQVHYIKGGRVGRGGGKMTQVYYTVCPGEI